MIRDILTASERASLLTRQLLAYAGKGRFIVVPISLSGLVSEISNLVQTSIPRTVQLRLDLQENLPTIEGDAGQLHQLSSCGCPATFYPRTPRPDFGDALT